MFTFDRVHSANKRLRNVYKRLEKNYYLRIYDRFRSIKLALIVFILVLHADYLSFNW